MAVYIHQLRATWARAEADQSDHRSPILRCIMTILVVLRFFSLSNIKYTFPENSSGRRHFMDCYVTVWLLGLVGVLLWVRPGNNLATFAAAYEAADIAVYRVYFFLVKSHDIRWQRIRLRRTLTLAVGNFLELVVAYAVLYLQAGTVVSTFLKPWTPLETPAAAFYFSLVTITTVGFGDFAPKTDGMRMLVAAELVSGLLMLVFLIPALISIFSDDLSREKIVGSGSKSGGTERP